MKKKCSNVLLLCVMALAIVLLWGKKLEAKTYKSIADGGYITSYKSAKISNGKLIIKGKVSNWERASATPYYSKSGKHKLKIAKSCSILDGYKPSYDISKKTFNKLCKQKDSSHRTIAFVVSGRKVTLVRFW